MHLGTDAFLHLQEVQLVELLRLVRQRRQSPAACRARAVDRNIKTSKSQPVPRSGMGDDRMLSGNDVLWQHSASVEQHVYVSANT